MSQAEFNQCAKLMKDNEKVLELRELYAKELSEGKNPFETMMEMQNTLQERYSAQHGRVPAPRDIKNKGELITFLLDQKMAIDDEFRELIEAVHGMSRPASERSAGWKKWKGKYDEIRAEGVDEGLSNDDIIERSMECVDLVHFVLNLILSLNISAEDLFVFYMMKNKENFDRQDNNY